MAGRAVLLAGPPGTGKVIKLLKQNGILLLMCLYMIPVYRFVYH